MNTPTNPKTVHKPLGTYSHMISVPPGAEWLVISGQVGINAKGKVASGAKAQCEQTFRNVLACLRAGKMKKEHLVKLTIYITDARLVETVRDARVKIMGTVDKPTSTLLVIDALAGPDLCVEVEAWAAKA